MHIVYVTKIYLPHIGGVELYIKKLADYFFARGNSVSVITADEKLFHITNESYDGIKVIRIPAKSINGIYFLRNKSDIRDIEHELSYADIVHVNDCKFLFKYFACKKHSFHYKLICSSHGWLFHTNKNAILKRLYFKNIVVKNSTLYDTIICVSEQDRHIANKYGLICDTLIYPGVDCEKYSGIPPKKDSSNIFFYWGRISQNKGILECLKKFSSLQTNYMLIIAGKCEYPTYMKKLLLYIAEHNMNDKVSFIGQISDREIKSYIIQSDFIVMPSLHEGFGITLVECLVSGRPIIANCNESYTAILTQTDAQNYLFNYQDANSNLQNKINELRKLRIYPKNIDAFSDNTVQKKIEQIYLA